MFLTCGFLGKSAGYYYYTQNVILFATGWDKVKVIYDNNILFESVNTNKEMKFVMELDNSYNILFKVDDKIIKKERQLFKIQLDVSKTNENNDFYKFEEGLIVDH
jgi:hypothetical protein